MASIAAEGRAGDSGRNLALVGYGLLFASVFFAGLPAVVAVVIAYSQRGAVPPEIASHHRFQIRIFWVGFALTLLATAGVLGVAVSLVGQVVEICRTEGWESFRDLRVEAAQLSFGGPVLLMAGMTAVFSLLTCLWLACASAIGFIRLASARGMGHSAAS